MLKLQSICILWFTAICYASAEPIDSTTKSFIAVTTKTDDEKEILSDNAPTEPKITDLYIHSNISNRFATTIIRSKVTNFAKSARETTFSVIIPVKAFISEFIMGIDGVNYTAYVQEKEKAEQTYQKARAQGIAAAHISARNSNKFVVNLNVEPENKCVFYLKYEELLQRKDGKYELIININPKQLVKNILVEVDINENRPLTHLSTPHIQSGNEITKEAEILKPEAKIFNTDLTTANVIFSPTIEKQKQIAQGLGVDEKEGISGQFIVQYDVERDPNGGEVLINEGHFVHFFAPSDVTPMNKYIVFVLDTSGSMFSNKMDQLKNAMRSIIKDLRSSDFFSLVEFSTYVKVWNLNAPRESMSFTLNDSLERVKFPPAYPVTNITINNALNAVNDFTANGGTNIYEAVRVGIHLIKLQNGKTVQPLIFFLTDGEATVGKTDTDKIVAEISEHNIFGVPIFSLSFGDGADRTFLEKLSLHNFGFSRHIYLDSDASLQLENFYQEVSSPLLKNVKFEYTPEVTSLTKVKFPVYFQGSEFVVAGKLPNEDFKFASVISCMGSLGTLKLKPSVTKSVSQLERLWAYMTIQKYLDVKKVNESLGAQFDEKALVLAMKYSFVTPVTSLVVVKPNDSVLVDAESSDFNSRVDDQEYLHKRIFSTGEHFTVYRGFQSNSSILSTLILKMLAVMEPQQTAGEPVTSHSQEFLTSGRTGRRNALPDILSEHAVVSSADLPSRLQKLSTTDGPSTSGQKDGEKPGTSKQGEGSQQVNNGS